MSGLCVCANMLWSSSPPNSSKESINAAGRMCIMYVLVTKFVRTCRALLCVHWYVIITQTQHLTVSGEYCLNKDRMGCIPASLLWLSQYMTDTNIKHYLSQRDANGSCPTAHIQYCAVLIQLGPFAHSRVQHLCSSCIHLPGNTDTLNTSTFCV